MPKSKITLTQIAKYAKLSITTVSRVIHKPHLTSKYAQQQVSDAIAKLGFEPSTFKPNTQFYSSKKILVIDNQLMNDSLINLGIESKSQQLGYKLLYLRFFFFTQEEIQQIVSYTINHQVDGILILNDSPYLNRLIEYQHALPRLVLVNQFSLTLPCVYFDHLSNTYQATKYLIEQGHKRIAILLGDKNKSKTHHIKQGYIQALTRANIATVNDLIIYQCFHYLATHKAVKNLMQLKQKPSAIICCDHIDLNYTDRDKLRINEHCDEPISSESAICGVIDQCQAMNIRIPADLSLLQFIHHKGHKQYRPLNHICGVYKPLFNMGENAVKLLVSMFDNACRTRESLLIDIEFIVRHSTAKINNYDFK